MGEFDAGFQFVGRVALAGVILLVLLAFGAGYLLH
jgi:hypothetical protein